MCGSSRSSLQGRSAHVSQVNLPEDSPEILKPCTLNKDIQRRQLDIVAHLQLRMTVPNCHFPRLARRYRSRCSSRMCFSVGACTRRALQLAEASFHKRVR